MGQRQRPIEVRHRAQGVAGGDRGVAGRFFERELLILQAQRLGTFQCAPVGRNRFVVGKNAFSLRGRLFRVSQSAFIFARVDEMMRKSFNCNRGPFAMLLEPFSRAQMQTTPANWV